MNDNRSGGEGLQRKLSPLNVWALALGSIIGWGAFVMPANTFLPNAGPLGTLIAMAAGAIIMVVIALNYSYMINHFPVAGGEFTFTNASFGPTCGFLCAWFLGLSYLAIVPLNATALALIGRNLFPNLTQWGYLYSVEGYSIYAGEILLAIIALALFAVFSIRGVSFFALVYLRTRLINISVVMVRLLCFSISERSCLIFSVSSFCSSSYLRDILEKRSSEILPETLSS